eukprot:COSAG05_NODE_9342_length_630_cov_1.259887_1_plen_152_part_10
MAGCYRRLAGLSSQLQATAASSAGRPAASAGGEAAASVGGAAVAASAGADGVLKGVRVVELSMVLAAPMACAMLADMGAEVVKVEPPSGEIWRRDGPPEQFQQLNRGKRSVVLDTQKDLAAMAALKKLLAGADVFVTNLRQQALVAQGLDFE